jgi:predicted permease
MLPLSDTFFASMRSVGTAATLAASGVYLHRKGMVTSESSTVLARFSQQIAIPALFFSSIVYCPQDFTTDKCPNVVDHLKDVWVLLLWPIYVVVCGLLVGCIATRLAGTPASQRPIVMATTAFANSTGLPITLLAVVEDTLRRQDASIARVDPNLFMSIYLILYPIIQWGIGGWLLAPTEELLISEKSNRKNEENGVHHVLNMDHHLEGFSLSMRNLPRSNPPLMGVAKNPDDDIEEDNLVTMDASSDAHMTESLVPGGALADRQQQHVHIMEISSTKAPMRETVLQVLSKSLQPPVVGAVLGLIVGATRPLRALFVDLNDRDNDSILAWFFQGIHTIGKAAVPVNMAVLGINLSISAQSTRRDDLVSPTTIAAVVIGKMIILPSIGILTTVFLRRFWHVPESIKSSFLIVLMIVFITPTANNVMVMASLSSSSMKEGMATLIGWQYLVAPLLLTLSMMLVVRVATA